MDKTTIVKIKSLRNYAGLSQEQMAELLSMSRLTYASIESGKRDLRKSELEKLASIFETTIEDLLSPNIKESKNQSTPKEEDPFYKFKQMFLYILSQCSQKPTVGKTVLNKLLYFADFNHHEKYFEAISGVEYIKLPKGPVPKIIDIILPAMESEQSIKQVEIPYYNYNQYRIIPLISADLSVLKGSEIKEIDDVVAKYSDKSADWLSERSHNDVPYRATEKIGDVISYGLVHYRDSLYSVSEWKDDDKD